MLMKKLISSFVFLLTAASTLPAAVLVTTNVQTGSANWTATIWKTNLTDTAALAPVAGNTYACLPNAVPFTNNGNFTLLRNPAAAGTQTFPGDMLTLNSNTSIRMKQPAAFPGVTLNFPGVGANPGLTLNGGGLHTGDATTNINISGKVHVTAPSVFDFSGTPFGTQDINRGCGLRAALTGSGSLTIQLSGTNTTNGLNVIGADNAFSGDWIVAGGYLKGTGSNSLGTGNLIVGSRQTFGYAPVVASRLELMYNINTPGSLILSNGGQLVLHQDCTFRRVIINGTNQTNRTMTYAQLSAAYPANFTAGGSGSLTLFSPVGLTTAGATNQINLTWTAAPGATNYVVLRATTAGGPYTRIATNATTSYANTGLPIGSILYYSVLAQDAIGETAQSPDVLGVTVPTAPSGLLATPGDTTVGLTWTPVTTATNYYIGRAVVSGGPYTLIGTNSAANFADTSVVNGTTYYYVVAALNSAGQGPDSSEASAMPDIAPAGLTAVGGNLQVTLDWVDLPGALNYFVKRAGIISGPYTTIASGVASSDYVDNTAASGSTYYYVVSAQMTSSESANSTPASATTIPAVPGSFAVTATNYASIVLGWTQSDPVVGGFVVERSSDGFAFAPLANVAAAARSFTDGSVDAATTYYYRALATNAAGASAYSATAVATLPVFRAYVNFQTAAAPTPPGYVADAGLIFGDRTNGHSYGWDADTTASARYRLAANSPDLRYDTFTHLQQSVPARYWEIAVPNGTYAVHLVAGEPSNFNSYYHLLVEGVEIVNALGTATNLFAEGSALCTVADGRLTVNVGAIATNAKICYVEITATNPVVAPLVFLNPTNRVAPLGRPARFSAGATGTLPLNPQWLFNGNILPGATNYFLELLTCRSGDSGGYSIVFSNSAGVVTSAVATLTVVGGSWVAVDTFDALPTGPINGVNGWVATNSLAQVANGLTDLLDKVLIANAAGAELPVYKLLGNQSLQNSAAGTVFFRMRRANAALNISIGLSDVAIPAAGFGDYEPQVNCNTTTATNLNLRDAGTFRPVWGFTNDVWYNVWMVVDNTRDLYSVYMQGADLLTPTLLACLTNAETRFTFRNTGGDGVNTNTSPVANDLISFMVRLTSGHTGPLYVDDVYIDAATTNLSNPVPPDTRAPTVFAASPMQGTNVYFFSSVAVTFSEPVLGLGATNLLINGTPATNLTGSGRNWTFQFPQPPTGAVSIAWAPDHSITDAVGNRFNEAGAGWTYTALDPDYTAPTISTVVPAPGSTLSSWGQIVVTFDEVVVGVEARELLVNGAPASAVTNSGNSYYFTAAVVPGEITVSFDHNHGIIDLWGNRFDENLPGHQWSYTLQDVFAPVVTVLSPPQGATVSRLDRVDVQFNEAVSGVDAADLLVNGSAATSVSGSGFGPYSFSFTQPANGLVTLEWTAGHGIQDTAPTPNAFAGGSWSNTLVAPADLGTVRINEFLANNVRNLSNELGQAEDWIELFNPGTNSVNLLGWSLTDDNANSNLWTFPDITLAPGQFLVVFADALDRKTYGGTNRLHTNFKLNDQGDYLALFNADLPRTAMSELAPEFPEQRGDYSYGLNSSDQWRYYATPTPGATNGDSSITNVTPFPHVSASRGIYTQPFNLVATCPAPDATLRYTTNGSQPTEVNGFLYSAPLTFSNTTVLRIAAFATNRLPSRVSTHSYIFVNSVLNQPTNPPGYAVGTNAWKGYPSDYEMDPEIVTNNPAWVRQSLLALPTVSIAIKIEDMFDPTTGIYVNPEPNPNIRYLWERACSVEYILTNGQTGFQVDCGIRVQGNASRTPVKTPKHPFRLFFKGAYGPGRLDYPLFGDSPVASFNTLVLRADFNNHWLHWDANQRLRGTKVRDPWVKDTFGKMNGISGHSKPFHLYINGLYWGVYDFGERIDAEFAASYLGGSAEEYDAIASKPTEAIDGTITAYNTMVGIGRSLDMTQPANYINIQQHLDMPVFLDYMILNFYGGNEDWGFDGNWNAVRRRASGETFKYVEWDGEQLLTTTNVNRVSNSDVPSGLHTNLIKSLQYRMDFADRAHRYCFNNGLLTPGSAAERWQQIARRVEHGMIAESARWGDYRRDVQQYVTNGPFTLYTTNGHWWPEVERVRTNYFPHRTAIFLNQLRAVGLYPNIEAPVFSQHGGQVRRGFQLSISGTNTIYFTTNNTDPRVIFTSDVAGDAVAYSGPITLDETTVVKARLRVGTNWSALNEATFEVSSLVPPVHITELMYNPPGGSAYEFVELRNDGNTPVDVSGWNFGGITYTFGAGTVLAAGQRIVLANNDNPAAFASRYPAVGVFDYYDGALDNAGERITLKDAAGNIIHSVDYDDAGGWPVAADGNGYSLEVMDAFGDPDAPSNWRATSLWGTPGASSTNPLPSVVRLNEVMADNATAVNNGGSYPDWVELHNSSGSGVDVSSWSLTDDSIARKYVLPPSTVIPAGGFLVVWCDTNTALPGLHTGFALSRNGQTVSLFDNNTNRVDALTFGLQLTDLSVGLVGGDWVLNMPTPGATNMAAAVDSPTNLFLNEWLANAAPGDSDWIELFNSATNPVVLRGLYLGTSNAVVQLQSLSFIAPLGHLQLLADEQAGVNHLDFKLPASAGAIALYDQTAAQIDRVTYGVQTERVSQGRLPDATANLVSFPSSASPGASNYISSYSGPLLNEVMAINRRAATNAAGHTADWVELYNPLGTSFDLSGFALSTSSGNPTQWLFPAGVTIAAGGYRVVWFDGDRAASTTNEVELHTGRSLDGDSDEVYLFNTGGQLVDGVEFGPQVADGAIGRSGGTWVLVSAPTPGTANAAAAALGSPVSLRLNEWLAAPLTNQDQFLEIYNTGTLPVQLGGLFLTDDLSLQGQAKFQIAELSFIAALDCTEFKADGDVSQGRNHVSFNLSSDAESLRLSDAALSVIDTIIYGLQASGISQGRLPDGTVSTADFACITPGFSNGLSATIAFPQPPHAPLAQLGGGTTFSFVALAGGSTFTYQWLSNGVPIPGANAAALLVENAQWVNHGDAYSVIVSNGCGYGTSPSGLLSVNRPPTAVTDSLTVRPGTTTIIAGVKLPLNDTDPDGDALVFAGATGPSAQGGTVSVSGASISYTPPNGFTGADSFTYVVNDVRGGTATGTVSLTVTNGTQPGVNQVGGISIVEGNALMTFRGIPGLTYTVQRTPEIAPTSWTNIGTAQADFQGKISFTDTNPPPGSSFYRTTYP